MATLDITREDDGCKVELFSTFDREADGATGAFIKEEENIVNDD
jgi:hypothetical protein